MAARKAALPVATESVEQQCLFRWAAVSAAAHPELRLMFHIPNGGSRSRAEAGRFKAEGVKAGVPDICLPVPRGGYHGLFIELKRTQGGEVSPEQTAWLDALRAQGYRAEVCKGWEPAVRVIEEYLKQKEEPVHEKQDGRPEQPPV